MAKKRKKLAEKVVQLRRHQNRLKGDMEISKLGRRKEIRKFTLRVNEKEEI